MLPAADYLVHLVAGKIDVQGTPADLQQAGLYTSIVAADRAPTETLEDGVEAANKETVIEEKGDAAAKSVSAPTLAEKERHEAEGVKWAVYKTYLLAA